jgi:hypothetical protein
VANDSAPSKIRTMLDMKLTVGQVLSGASVTIGSVVSIMLYVNTTFETKIDAAEKDRANKSQIAEMKTSFQRYQEIQTQIYGDVKEISGILKSQIAEKTARGGR